MMSGTPSTPRRTIRHRRRSFVTNPPLVPQPIIDEHIKFREVVDDASGEIAGKEVTSRKRKVSNKVLTDIKPMKSCSDDSHAPNIPRKFHEVPHCLCEVHYFVSNKIIDISYSCVSVASGNSAIVNLWQK